MVSRTGLLDVVDRRVQQQRDVRLGDDLLEQDGVEDERVALGVAVQVLDEDLVDHAAFARPAVVVPHVGRGAEDPQPHLARGVAAEHRAVLDQHDLEAGPRRGDGAARAGESAADHDEVAGEADGLGFAPVSREFADHKCGSRSHLRSSRRQFVAGREREANGAGALVADEGHGLARGDVRDGDRVPAGVRVRDRRSRGAVAVGEPVSGRPRTRSRGRRWLRDTTPSDWLAQPEDAILDRFRVDVVDIGRAFNTDDAAWRPTVPSAT